MRLNGQTQHIADSEDEDNRKVRDLPQISRSEYVEDVASRLRYTTGCELSGLFDPRIVGELFVEQSEPWEGIARRLAEEVLEAADLTIQLIVEHVAASEVAEGVLKFVRKGIEQLRVDLDNQIDLLLASAAQDPITNNPSLIMTVGQIQHARQQRRNTKMIHSTFGAHRFDSPDSKISVNLIQLQNLMGKAVDPDTERAGSALAVDYMVAYYKV